MAALSRNLFDSLGKFENMLKVHRCLPVLPDMFLREIGDCKMLLVDLYGVSSVERDFVLPPQDLRLRVSNNRAQKNRSFTLGKRHLIALK